MKSATSFFNLTLMKKNLTRFWPIWALYTVIWIYILPVHLLDTVRYITRENVSAYITQYLYNSTLLGLGLAVAFGILTAMAMFSYLYSPRSAGLFHSLPVRREGLFLSAYVSGLACMLLPNAVIWLLTLAVQAPYGVELGAVTLWLLVQSGTCLFFFSFGVFCAVFTGHLLALPLFYAILNALAGVLYLLVSSLFRAYLYGFDRLPEGVERAVMWLMPVVRMAYALASFPTGAETYALSEPWVVAVYAAVGLLLAAVALAVYRHRHIETAGDVVAVPLMRPLFKYGVAVCSCLCFGYWVCSALLGLNDPVSLTVSLLLWAAAGYFVAEMLLRKSFRVLNAWKGCLVLLAVTGACILGLHMDFFGFAARVPQAQDVAVVSLTSLHTYPYDNGANINVVDVSDPDTIARVAAVHQAVVDQYKNGDYPSQKVNSTSFNVTYVLKNGAVLSRRYYLIFGEGSPLTEALQALVDDPVIALSGYGLESIDPDALTDVSLYQLWNNTTLEFDYINLSELDISNSRQAMRTIYDAVMADFAEGNLGRRYLSNIDPERLSNTYWTNLQLEWQVEQRPVTGSTSSNSAIYYNSMEVTLTPQAVHTIQALTQLGLLDKDHMLLLYGDPIPVSEEPGLGYFDSYGNPFPTYEAGTDWTPPLDTHELPLTPVS